MTVGAGAVQDAAGNGILAVAATTVTNAIIANEPPEFSPTTATREVPENTAENTNIGAALPAATDADNDPLTYTLEDADAASFDFNAATRQLSTKSGVTYDHETTPSYSVTLKADDDNGGSDTLAVTITITDVEEPPGRPAAPSVSSVGGNTTSLEVNWTAPSNTGPTIDDYDLRYREGTTGSWTNGPENQTGTNATIPGLTESTSYQVQVLARNAEGDSPGRCPVRGRPARWGRQTCRTASTPRAQPAGDAQLGAAIRRRGGHRLRIRAGRFREVDLHGQHGHHHHGAQPDQRPELHVPGAGGQQRRGERGLHRLGERHPGHGARRADEPRRHGRRPGGGTELDGARVKRRGHDHRLRVRAERFRDLDLHRRHGHHLRVHLNKGTTSVIAITVNLCCL